MEENKVYAVSPEMKFTKNEREHYSNYSGKAKFSSPEEEEEWSKNQVKKCNKCSQELPLTEFGTNTSGDSPFNKDGIRYRRGDCKSCNKKMNSGKNEAKKIAESMGLSYKAPEGTCCENCGKSENIVFDHHHEKNTFRGWLCDGCNRSIGVLGETIDKIVNVVNYQNRSDKKKLAIIQDEYGNDQVVIID